MGCIIELTNYSLLICLIPDAVKVSLLLPSISRIIQVVIGDIFIFTFIANDPGIKTWLPCRINSQTSVPVKC